jgi:hypothetical protein
MYYQDYFLQLIICTYRNIYLLAGVSACCLPHANFLLDLLFLILKMEAMCSFEMFIHFHHTASWMIELFGMKNVLLAVIGAFSQNISCSEGAFTVTHAFRKYMFLL